MQIKIICNGKSVANGFMQRPLYKFCFSTSSLSFCLINYLSFCSISRPATAPRSPTLFFSIFFLFVGSPTTAALSPPLSSFSLSRFSPQAAAHFHNLPQPRFHSLPLTASTGCPFRSSILTLFPSHFLLRSSTVSRSPPRSPSSTSRPCFQPSVAAPAFLLLLQDTTAAASTVSLFSLHSLKYALSLSDLCSGAGHMEELVSQSFDRKKMAGAFTGERVRIIILIFLGLFYNSRV